MQTILSWLSQTATNSVLFKDDGLLEEDYLMIERRQKTIKLLKGERENGCTRKPV